MWAAGARVPPQRDDVGATGQPGFDDVDEGFIDGERLVAGPSAILLKVHALVKELDHLATSG